MFTWRATTQVTLGALSVLIWQMSKEGLPILLEGYCEVEARADTEGMKDPANVRIGCLAV